MSFWKNLATGGISMLSPRVTHLGAQDIATLIGDMTAAEMFATQHSIRTVIDFLARNVAHLGLACYRRQGATDRQVDHDSPLAAALRRPDVDSTLYETLYALVGDLALYDRAYWHVPETAPGESPILRRIPPTWVEEVRKTLFGPPTYKVSYGARTIDLSADEVLSFTGWSPSEVSGCSPAITTLKDVLAEQISAAQYRGQVWKNGGKVSAVLERPSEAARWTKEAKERFREDWQASYSGDGPGVGGTPILEDGMRLSRIDFNARDQQYVEGSKLALAQVAAAWHVSPTMVGILDDANYSNVREFRRALYGETLGPTLRRIEHRINAFLLPKLNMDSREFFVEFDSASKLRAPIDEEAAALQTSVGGPWLTRNEARARQNLQAVDGGDELITPLNVLVGGQASPTDSGSQNRAIEEDPLVKTISEFFCTQARSVSSAIGANKSVDWVRWTTRLAETVREAGWSGPGAKLEAETKHAIGVTSSMVVDAQVSDDNPSIHSILTDSATERAVKLVANLDQTNP